MKVVISTLLCCLIVTQANAIQIPYKSLKKAYANDQEKCLVRSERWIKILPNNPAGYYYASMIHFERAQKESTTRKKYNELSKSLKYARELESLKTQSFLAQVEWDTLTPVIGLFTRQVQSALEDEDLDQLSESLEKKVKRFDWEIADAPSNTYTASNEGTTEHSDLTEATEVSTSSFRNGQYFGRPTGTEMVASFNVQSEKEMLAYINAERAKKGQKPLVWEEDLAKAARYHAFDMGSQDYFEHDSHDRTNGNLKEVAGTFERIRAFYNTTFVNSENIAAGNEGAKDTYMQWFNSPGHYDNMFNGASGKVGIGVCYVPGSTFGYYWVFCTAY